MAARAWKGWGEVSSTRKASFFDHIAGSWDDWHDLPRLAAALAAGLEELGVGREETVLDVGCGTGNLTAALLERLSPVGRVVAVDISPRMIAMARAKIVDRRVSWQVADAEALPLLRGSCDRAICLAVWPHLDNWEEAAAELARVLRPGGALHIWHLAGREEVNRIHRSASGPISSDLLAPARETAALLERFGFRVIAAVDDTQRYVVSARAARARGG